MNEVRIFGAVALVFGGVGAFIVVTTAVASFAGELSAPQETAGSALGIAVTARSIEMATRKDPDREERDRAVARIEEIKRERERLKA